MEYYHKNSDVVAFERIKDSRGFIYEYTYDDNGNQLTYKGLEGYSYEYTYDDKGKALTYKDSDDFGWESTYDDNGNQLTFKSSDGYFEIKGRQVTKKEFEDFTNRPFVGKKVIVDGVEYQLK